MSSARAKIMACLIRKDKRTLNDIADADRDDVRAAYLELFGEELT